MRRSITLAALGAGTVLGAALPALAQTADGEWQVDFEATGVGAAIEDESALAPSAPSALGSATLAVTRSDTFENGLTLGWRGEVRLERDAPSRPAFAGVLGACPANSMSAIQRRTSTTHNFNTLNVFYRYHLPVHSAVERIVHL